MGFALAEEAARRGADVTVVAANVSLPRAPGIEYVDVSTAAELAAACRERFAGRRRPADGRRRRRLPPGRRRARTRSRRTDGGANLALELERTEDVLTALAAERRPGQLLVGFAAEHGDGALAYGRDKLERKRLDAVVVNDVSGAGYRASTRRTTRSRSSPPTASGTFRGPPRRRSRRRSSTPS